MAYKRHDWECGDVVTAELLNNIEDGIEEALECCGGGGGSAKLVLEERAATVEECANGGFVSIITSHTWQEIYDLIENGTPMCAYYNDDGIISMQPVVFALASPVPKIPQYDLLLGFVTYLSNSMTLTQSNYIASSPTDNPKYIDCGV